MANTYTLISSVTVGSGGSTSIAFSSIPSTYTDLMLILSLRQDQTAANDGQIPAIALNGSSSSFTSRTTRGTGSAASAFSSTINILTYGSDPSDFTASVFANAQVYFPNYTSSSNKSFTLDGVTENNATSAQAAFQASLWSNTAAITSITLTPFIGGSAKFVQYSTAYLYGISNA
jgi:hypothetical protein